LAKREQAAEQADLKRQDAKAAKSDIWIRV
jgi:hypothetical protein